MGFFSVISGFLDSGCSGAGISTKLTKVSSFSGKGLVKSKAIIFPKTNNNIILSIIEIKNDLPKKLFLLCFKRFVLYLSMGTNYLHLIVNYPIYQFTNWPIKLVVSL